MNKPAFLKNLKKHLKKLKNSEIQKNINYYDELLSDMMENGAPEAEAVEKIGSPKSIAQEILQNAAPEDFKPRDTVGTVLIVISALLVAVILLSELSLSLLPLTFHTSSSSTAVSIIGGADGPTSIFLAGKVGTPTSLYAAAATVITMTVIYKLIRHFKQ